MMCTERQHAVLLTCIPCAHAVPAPPPVVQPVTSIPFTTTNPFVTVQPEPQKVSLCPRPVQYVASAPASSYLACKKQLPYVHNRLIFAAYNAMSTRLEQRPDFCAIFASSHKARGKENLEVPLGIQADLSRIQADVFPGRGLHVNCLHMCAY